MVYYFSIEYLLGRHLQNAVLNLDIGGKYGEALKKLGFSLEDLYNEVQKQDKKKKVVLITSGNRSSTR